MRPRHSAPSHLSPALTGGDDRPTPSCQLDPFWFDEALDHKPGTRAHRVAVAECKSICDGCDFKPFCAVEWATLPGVVAGKTADERGAA